MERFFKRKSSSLSTSDNNSGESSKVNATTKNQQDNSTFSTPINVVDMNHLPWDPSDRPRILQYNPNQRNDIRRAYWLRGPCQPHGHDFPKTIIGNKPRRFIEAWLDDVEKLTLEHQLDMYHHSVLNDEDFANLNGIVDLSRVMVETRKHLSYPLVYKLLKLTLVLPVATATVERCFSAMKLVKTDLRNRIGEDFLSSCLMCAVEKEILNKVSNDDVIERFQKMSKRKGQI